MPSHSRRPNTLITTPRYSGLASRLTALPPELVHKVLDDLPLSRVLEISCHGHVFLDECILTHLVYRRYFTRETFNELRNLYRLYIEISSRRRSHPYPHPIACLQPDARVYGKTVTPEGEGKGKFEKERRVTEGWISHTKAADIRLLNVYKKYEWLLEEYAPEPERAQGGEGEGEGEAVGAGPERENTGDDTVRRAEVEEKLASSRTPSATTTTNTTSTATSSSKPRRIPSIGTASYARLNAYWRAVDAAETALNAHKAAQLTRLGDLLTQYPHHLHSYTDSSQETARNPQHAANRFYALAKVMPFPQILEQGFMGKCIFTSHRFPLVPYDRFLKLFLKTLERHPPAGLAEMMRSIRQRELKYAHGLSQELGMLIAAAEPVLSKHQDAVVKTTLDLRERERTRAAQLASASLHPHSILARREAAVQAYVLHESARKAQLAQNTYLEHVEHVRVLEQEREKLSRSITGLYRAQHHVRALPHTYPAEIDAAIRTAVEGMAYVNTGPETPDDHRPRPRPRRRLWRTIYTPFSSPPCANPDGQRQPSFVMAHDKEHAGKYRRWNRPIREEEFVWLEAFLKCCKYMSEMNVPWRETVLAQDGGGEGKKGEGKEVAKGRDGEMSVAEYWRKHT